MVQVMQHKTHVQHHDKTTGLTSEACSSSSAAVMIAFHETSSSLTSEAFSAAGSRSFIQAVIVLRVCLLGLLQIGLAPKLHKEFVCWARRRTFFLQVLREPSYRRR
jgi:hypothetical protein